MSGRIGTVALVGAGPGDPGLITARGLELLRRADVVVHDRLIGMELLDEAPATARRVAVGKAPGRHLATQEQIDAIIVAHALRGRAVVRLKGGDPFLYGRGVEEREACRRAGVPCEVVPGVSSALAAPAAAGIPLTARGTAASVAIVTPRAAAGGAHALDFAALAALDTVCVLMGRAALADVAAGLIGAGRAPATPAAVVERGTMAGQRSIVGRLDAIAARADAEGLAAPVVLVVGDVARLGDAARTTGPLAGRRVVVTRPRRAARAIVSRLRELGADVLEMPLIDIAYRPPDAGLDVLDRHRWLVFASRHGVIGLFRWLEARGADARALGHLRVAVVGPSTAAALRRFGVRADDVATPHRATALARLVVEGQRAHPGPALLPIGSRAGDELPAALAAGGVGVEPLHVYDTLTRRPDAAARRALDRGVDAALLHSPSAARAWVDAGLPARGPVFACIGPTTASAAARLGLQTLAVAADHLDEGLVETLVQRWPAAAGEVA